MTDIRLEEFPFDLDGKTYLLRCNMNVLADVQEAFGGTIAGALSGESANRSVMEFLAAMLNDYADEKGWPERFTARQLGRRLPLYAVRPTVIMGLVTRSITPPDDEDRQQAVSEPDTGGGSDREPDDAGN